MHETKAFCEMRIVARIFTEAWPYCVHAFKPDSALCVARLAFKRIEMQITNGIEPKIGSFHGHSSPKPTAIAFEDHEAMTIGATTLLHPLHKHSRTFLIWFGHGVQREIKAMRAR